MNPLPTGMESVVLAVLGNIANSVKTNILHKITLPQELQYIKCSAFKNVCTYITLK